jgi:hypothetical protein
VCVHFVHGEKVSVVEAKNEKKKEKCRVAEENLTETERKKKRRCAQK